MKNLAFLTQVRQSLALFQHHDAIAGTCRVKVAKDYENRLVEALFLSCKVFKNAINFLTSTINTDDDHVQSIKVHETPSNRELTPSDHVVHIDPNGGIRLSIVNDIAHRRQELIQIVVDMQNVQVADLDGHIVTSQVSPVWIDKKEQSIDSFLLTFIANVLPLSLTYHDITAVTGDCAAKQMAVVKTYMEDQVSMTAVTTIENEHLSLKVSQRSGKLLSLTPKRGGDGEQETNLHVEAVRTSSLRSGLRYRSMRLPGTTIRRHDLLPDLFTLKYESFTISLSTCCDL